MTDAPARSPDRRARTLLNAGSGPPSPRRLYPGFAGAEWNEVTLDINPAAETDFVGSVADLRELFDVDSFDAVWSSHNVEHLYAHEVVPALQEFRRVLKPWGFALITCPDLEAAAGLLVTHGLDHQAYHSPAGPISVRDIIFGYGRSIAAGDLFMAHHTGFTRDSLGRAALEAGFAEARVGIGDRTDLWAVLMMPEADDADIRDCLESREGSILFPSNDT